MTILTQLKLMFVSHAETVSKHFGEIGIVFTVIGTAVSYAVGGWDKALIALIAFVTFDIITGCIRGFFVEKDFTSKRLREGFGTKVMYVIVIAVGNLLDGVFFAEMPVLRNLALFFYIYVEGVSILENLGAMGVPIPQKLVDGLGQVEKKVGGFAKMENGKFKKSDDEDQNVG